MSTITEERVTRRVWLIEATMIEAMEAGEAYDIWTVIEAVSSTAIEHPEWDMTELRTRKEWSIHA